MHSKFKIVASFDKGFGALVGFVRGIVFIEVIIMVCGIIPIGFMQTFYANLTSAAITGLIEKISLFNAILRWVSKESVLALVKILL